MTVVEASTENPGYSPVPTSPIGACYPGAIFGPGGVPAGHLSGALRGATETTFNAGRRVGACLGLLNRYEFADRPATPLHDAHQGGCFMYRRLSSGGRIQPQNSSHG